MYRKGFLLITLPIIIFVLNNCAYISIYKGDPIDADSINYDAASEFVEIRTGKYFINVNGTKREFFVTLPENYDILSPTRSFLPGMELAVLRSMLQDRDILAY